MSESGDWAAEVWQREDAERRETMSKIDELTDADIEQALDKLYEIRTVLLAMSSCQNPPLAWFGHRLWVDTEVIVHSLAKEPKLAIAPEGPPP